MKPSAGNLTLDVGSGHNPRGDVNIDRFKRYAYYSPNFIVADACFLPFKDKAFGSATCIHAIEHIPNPSKVIKELIRVTDGNITIKTPFRNLELGLRRRNMVRTKGSLGHLWGFNKKWFQPIQKIYPKTEINYSQFFVIPTEITVGVNTTVKARHVCAQEHI